MSLQSEFADLIRSIVREELDRAAQSSDARLLTAERVAEMLDFSDVHSVYRLKRDGELTPIMLSDRTLRFRYSDVVNYIERKAAATDLTEKNLKTETTAPYSAARRAAGK